MKSSGKLFGSPYKFLLRTLYLYRHPEDKTLCRKLKTILGFAPYKIQSYKTSLIHKSASISDGKGYVQNNERLEFLGDAILDAVISDYLYNKFPLYDEGFLTQMRSKIVKGANLSELAKNIGLTGMLQTQVADVARNIKIQEDAFEAFIGAIYMDRGYVGVTAFVLRLLDKNLIDMGALMDINENFKSQLIEWGQKYKRKVVFETQESGHRPLQFTCIIKIDDKQKGQGKGGSKKEAEQAAAKRALARSIQDKDYRDILNNGM